jgi:hypothetical protein
MFSHINNMFLVTFVSKMTGLLGESTIHNPFLGVAQRTLKRVFNSLKFNHPTVLSPYYDYNQFCPLFNVIKNVTRISIKN